MTNTSAQNSSEKLTVDDNALARELAGEHDQNLALLEDRLGVRIDPRGNEFTVTGGVDARSRTISALKRLYKRLEDGGKR